MVVVLLPIDVVDRMCY